MSQQWSLGPGETYRCFLPPVQVFSLGVMYRLFGPDPLYGQLLNVAYGTLTVVGLWYLGTRILGEHAGRLAALLGALLPSSVFACMLLGAEAPEVFWLVLALCLFVAGVEQRDKLWAAALCGLCLGVGALIRPTYLLIPAAMGLHLLLAGHRRARALAATAVIGLCTLAVVAPWTIRNYNVTGGLVIISSNGGGNLYSANNPDAHGGYTASAWDYLFHNCPDDLSLQRVGSQRAREWISRNKPRFAELCVARFFLFWEQDKECVWWAIEQPATDESNPRRPQMIQDRRMWTLAQLASDGFYFAAMLAALVGVVRRRAMWRTRHEWMILPILCAYFTAVHMVFESQGKYRYMLTPLMLLLAAAAIGRKDPAAEEARTMADR
jgi:4-amino-4-deoxy-L-arabinose transferase-like glycosyltransferase